MKYTILWDFDGVILDSMAIRERGFVKIFNSYTEDQIAKLLDYHRENGGLSRYVKIQYFFDKVLNSSCTEEDISYYANSFSKIMRTELIDPTNLITDSVSFIKQNYQKFNFHIVSGSDQEELRFLCSELGISKYFISIHGSPTSKTELIKIILKNYNYDLSCVSLIGDSVNDFDAAKNNLVKFHGYNNEELKKHPNYIKSFSTYKFNI